MTGNVQKRLVVYLDACFVSHWAGQDLDNPIQAEKHALSMEWWRRMEGRVRPVVSYVVLAEISNGKNATDALRRGKMVFGLESWGPRAEASALADELLDSEAVRRSKDNDALHIALAAVHGADVLLSWNCQDIVNEKRMPKIKAVVERAGYRCPLLISPKEHLEAMP
jgi:predicted nucleic acid-binding protein